MRLVFNCLMKTKYESQIHIPQTRFLPFHYKDRQAESVWFAGFGVDAEVIWIYCLAKSIAPLYIDTTNAQAPLFGFVCCQV